MIRSIANEIRYDSAVMTYRAGETLVSNIILSYFYRRMNIKQKLTLTTFLLSGGLAFLSLTAPIAAADCAGVKTSIINCSQPGGDNIQDTGVWGVLMIALNFMTAGVGFIGVGGIVYASILYASAGDNANQVQEAKDIIKNVIIGLIAFAGMYILLNFLIPGGIFT